MKIEKQKIIKYLIDKELIKADKNGNVFSYRNNNGEKMETPRQVGNVKSNGYIGYGIRFKNKRYHVLLHSII